MSNDKYRHIFDTKHLNDDLKKRSLKSGAVTLTSQGMMFVIQLASTMILARILTPQDYGKMAMVVSVTGLAVILNNLGLSTATVQRAEITHEQVSTLFWINAGIGALVTLVVASLSPVVAWFYKTPELTWMMLALSCNFFINGLAVQHGALLNRQMKFYALAKIQVLSMLFGIVAAIVAAFYGLGYWALVINSVVNSLSNFVGAWLSSGWVPGRPRKSAEVKAMVKFGTDLVVFNVINYFSRNLDNILIGRYHGSGALGIYSKAYQLLMMPITNLRDPLNKVAMPTLSRLQSDDEQYKNYYIKFLSILSFVTMPLVVFMYVTSENIINLFLGSQWLEASEIFRILAFVAFIQPLTSTRGLVMLTTGKSRRYLLVGAWGAAIAMCAFALGVPWGAKGVATAYVLSSYMMLFPFLIISFKGTPIKINNFLMAIYRPFFSSILMGVICSVLITYIQEFPDVYLLIISLIISASAYCSIIMLLPGGRDDFRELMGYVSIILKK